MNEDDKEEMPLVKEEEASTAPQQIREITVRGVTIAVLLGLILASANTYLGLYIGVPISVAIPSAIISVSLLKAFDTTPQEVNAIQTASSAGSCISSGMIYSIPALVIIGYWDSIDWLQTTLTILLGGLLGMLFSIPIRRALIIESPLPFPEGVATAEVIMSALPPKQEQSTLEHETTEYNAKKGLLLLISGLVCGGLLSICSSSLYLWQGVASWAFWVNSIVFYIGLTLSPAIIATGYIVGFRSCVMVFMGGVFCWWAAIPLTMAYEDIPYEHPDNPTSVAFSVWEDYTRYIGIGAMLCGSIGTLFLLAKPMFHGIKSGLQAFRMSREHGMKQVAREDRDIPLPVILVSVSILIVPLFLLCWYFIEIWYVGAFASVVMLCFGFLFACVGAYLAGVIGSGVSPISGITLATVITSALLLLIFLGFENPVGPAAAILIGAVIACATSMGSDSMQDLQTGHLVGSTPYKLQIMQIVGILLPSLLLPVVLNLVIQAYGIGEATEQHPEPLIAPQANLVADISHAIFYGGAPLYMVGIGALFSLVIIIFDALLMLCKSSFRLQALTISMGLYFPFGNVAALFVGSAIAMASHYVLRKAFPTDKDMQESLHRFGILFGAGLITGQAIAGVVFAIPVVITDDIYVLSVVGGAATVVWPGVIVTSLLILSMFIVPTYPAIIRLFQNCKNREI